MSGSCEACGAPATERLWISTPLGLRFGRSCEKHPAWVVAVEREQPARLVAEPMRPEERALVADPRPASSDTRGDAAALQPASPFPDA